MTFDVCQLVLDIYPTFLPFFFPPQRYAIGDISMRAEKVSVLRNLGWGTVMRMRMSSDHG